MIDTSLNLQIRKPVWTIENPSTMGKAKIVCKYCERCFRTDATLKGHISGFHQITNEDNCEMDAESEADKSSDSEMDSDEEKECSQNENDASSDDGNDEDVEDIAWKEVIQNACDQMDWNGEPADLLKEPTYTVFHDQLGKEIELLLEKAEAINNSDIMEKVKGRADHYLKDEDSDYDNWEAQRVAWDDRKHAVWRWFDGHKYLLQPDDDDSNSVHSEADGSSDDDSDNDDDTNDNVAGQQHAVNYCSNMHHQPRSVVIEQMANQDDSRNTSAHKQHKLKKTIKKELESELETD